LPGESKEQILKSPILKKYQNLGYEVLILHEPIDEFTMQHITEFDKKKILSIAKDEASPLD
jgi:HSP90 family molecular chaperone